MTKKILLFIKDSACLFLALLGGFTLLVSCAPPKNDQANGLVSAKPKYDVICYNVGVKIYSKQNVSELNRFVEAISVDGDIVYNATCVAIKVQ